jgi:hypothetical protein
MALNDSIGRMLLATKIPYPTKATHELISESGTSTSPITTAIERKIVVARRISSAVKGKSRELNTKSHLQTLCRCD